MRSRQPAPPRQHSTTRSAWCRAAIGAGLALTLLLALTSRAEAVGPPWDGHAPVRAAAGGRAEALPGEVPPQAGGSARWLSVLVFMGVTFPVLVLLLALVSRKQAVKVSPVRTEPPRRPTMPPAGRDASVASTRLLVELRLSPAVPDGAFRAGPSLPLAPRAVADSEEALDVLPADAEEPPVADPPHEPLHREGVTESPQTVPPPPAPAAPERADKCWCSTCAVAVAPGPGGSLRPWCPRCGSCLGPVPEWARAPRPALGDGPARPLVPTLDADEPLRVPLGKGVVYTATVKARCWKQHTCSACGGVYRYKFDRTGVGQARVRHLAQDDAEKTLRGRLVREVDSHPCPTCGLVQPDMVAQAKLPWHAGSALVLLALLAGAIVPAYCQALTYHVAGLICTGLAATGALLHLLVALRNPNRNRDANRERAKAEIERHRVEMVERGSMTDVSPPPRNLTLTHAVALVATAAGAAVFLGPELVRQGTDLPVNPGLTPFVVGPGDEVKLGFPKDHDLHSVGARWRATATAKVLNAAEVGAPDELPASSSSQSWQDGFTVHAGSEHASPDLWARVRLPGGDTVGGKTLRLQVSLDVVYPSDCGDSGLSPTYQNREARVTREFTVRVAEADDKADYEWASWLAVVAGPLGVLGGGGALVWLAVALRRRARPTQVEWRQV